MFDLLVGREYFCLEINNKEPMKHFTTTILVALMAVSAPLAAQNFTVSLKDGNTLFFNVTDSLKNTVEVSSVHTNAGARINLPKGSLSIPSTVRYHDTVWHVTAVADHAFADATKLDYVSLPSSVLEVGASAFAQCKTLKGIVFPSSQTKIASDAFSGCKALANISFGSDWTEIDLGLFRDSDSLRIVRIPVRVSKLTNLKQLAALERVEVDPNNPHFSSVDGLLYSNDGKALYACPRARKGDIVIQDGTETILEGAIWDCPALESVTLPASVKKVSYLEFSRCTNLASLSILSSEPLMTARREGQEVFCFRVPSPAFTVYVPADAVEDYRSALCVSAGNYENLDGRQKAYYHMSKYEENSFLAKKSVKKIRK